jgi:hypothetical protein
MTGRRRQRQSGQAMILVAVALIALIGSAALVLLAGSVEWQKNQLQELADQAALAATSTIGVGCNAAKAAVVIRAADNFLAGRRARTGPFTIGGGTCANPYVGADNFAGPMRATINYPFRAHQQQVEVILTLTLPISFGTVEGIRNTSVTRRALAQAPAASVPAITATTLDCQANAPVNIQGSVQARNLITSGGNCALYTHGRFDAASRTWSDFGNVTVGRDGQGWVRVPGQCAGVARRAICSEGYELTGTINPACGTPATSFLSAPDRVLNPNPCAVGVNPLPAFVPPAANLPPDPNTDPPAIATLRNAGGGPLGVACNAGIQYPVMMVGGVAIGRGLGPLPVRDAAGYYHFRPSCYGYLDISRLPAPNPRRATFDPGFYYFNGVGTPGGGGGVCLNGTAQLAGRDITMEFVRTANFNSGACNGAGGGAGTFGSNVAIDPPTRLTWLAAPCAVSPTAGDVVSCRAAASWCPTGDRACWNRLIWAPAAMPGTFQITSTGARAWLLGSISWPGNCLWGPNGASAITGAVSCNLLRFTNGTSNLATIGGDAGVSTALTEALLIE